MNRWRDGYTAHKFSSVCRASRADSSRNKKKKKKDWVPASHEKWWNELRYRKGRNRAAKRSSSAARGNAYRKAGCVIFSSTAPTAWTRGIAAVSYRWVAGWSLERAMEGAKGKPLRVKKRKERAVKRNEGKLRNTQATDTGRGGEEGGEI